MKGRAASGFRRAAGPGAACARALHRGRECARAGPLSSRCAMDRRAASLAWKGGVPL